jgi:hypothetical protein
MENFTRNVLTNKFNIRAANSTSSYTNVSISYCLDNFDYKHKTKGIFDS